MNYTFDKNVLSCRACKTYSNKETFMTSTGLKKKKKWETEQVFENKNFLKYIKSCKKETNFQTYIK